MTVAEPPKQKKFVDSRAVAAKKYKAEFGQCEDMKQVVETAKRLIGEISAGLHIYSTDQDTMNRILGVEFNGVETRPSLERIERFCKTISDVKGWGINIFKDTRGYPNHSLTEETQGLLIDLAGAMADKATAIDRSNQATKTESHVDGLNSYRFVPSQIR